MSSDTRSPSNTADVGDADGYSSAGELLRNALSTEELNDLKRVDDVRSAFAIFVNFALVGAWMALVALWPNPFTIVLALFGIGARQLGFAVLMHDAAHRALFSNRRVNDWAGNWLAAYPVWSEVGPYRRYHLVHHAYTGTPKDPDLALTRPFPATRRSLARKFWRDLSGQTGVKQAILTAKRDLGTSGKASQRTRGLKSGEQADVGWHKLAPFACWNLALLAICWASGHPFVYFLYPVAFLTSYRLVLRIRSIAEHSMSGPLDDPLQNTRTTLPSWWERIFLAPFGINYHLEHHFVMTIPWYNLKRMHALLRDRGYMADALVTSGYTEVLRLASSKAA